MAEETRIRRNVFREPCGGGEGKEKLGEVKRERESEELYTSPNHIFPIQSAFGCLADERNDRTKNHYSLPRGRKERKKESGTRVESKEERGKDDEGGSESRWWQERRQGRPRVSTDGEGVYSERNESDRK